MKRKQQQNHFEINAINIRVLNVRNYYFEIKLN